VGERYYFLKSPTCDLSCFIKRINSTSCNDAHFCNRDILLRVWRKAHEGRLSVMNCCSKSTAFQEEEVSDDESDEETVITLRSFKDRFSQATNIYNRFHDNIELLAGKAQVPLKFPGRENILFSAETQVVSANGKTTPKIWYMCITTEYVYILRKIIRLKKMKRYVNKQRPRPIGHAIKVSSARVSSELIIHFPKKKGGDVYLNCQLKEELITAVKCVYRNLTNESIDINVFSKRDLTSEYNTARKLSDNSAYRRSAILKKRKVLTVNSWAEELTISSFTPHYIVNQHVYGKTTIVTKTRGKVLHDSSPLYILKEHNVYPGSTNGLTEIDGSFRIANEQIVDEVKCLRQLSHPFLMTFHGDFLLNDMSRHYLVFDFESGGTLKRYITENEVTSTVGKFLLAQLLVAISYLHSERVVVKSFNPEFIYLNAKGHIKLGCFGYQFDISLKSGKRSDIRYLAPEFLIHRSWNTSTKIGRYRDGFVPKECDFWSLGVLVYEMYSGTYPFYAKEIDLSNEQCLNTIRENILSVQYPPVPGKIDGFVQVLIENLLDLVPERRGALFESQANPLESISKHHYWKSGFSSLQPIFNISRENCHEVFSAFVLPVRSDITEYYPDAKTYDGYMSSKAESEIYETANRSIDASDGHNVDLSAFFGETVENKVQRTNSMEEGPLSSSDGEQQDDTSARQVNLNFSGMNTFRNPIGHGSGKRNDQTPSIKSSQTYTDGESMSESDYSSDESYSDEVALKLQNAAGASPLTRFTTSMAVTRSVNRALVRNKKN
jgi:serine/threonine protein kinase